MIQHRNHWLCAIVGLLIRLKGNPKCISGNSLNPLGGACEQYMFILILLCTFLEKEVSAWQNDTSILKMTATSGKSFKCDQDQDIPLKAKNKMKVTVMIKQIHLQPFDSDAKKEFGEG